MGRENSLGPSSQKEPSDESVHDAYETYVPQEPTGVPLLDVDAERIESEQIKDRYKTYSKVFANAITPFRNERIVEDILANMQHAGQEIHGLEKKLEGIRTGDLQVSHLTLSALHVQYAGALFAHRDATTTTKKFANKQGFGERIEKFVQVSNFLTGTLDIASEDISLVDFIKQDKKHTLPVSSLFGYFMKMSMKPEGEPAIKGDSASFAKEYPNTVLGKYFNAQVIPIALINAAFHEDAPEFAAVQQEYPQGTGFAKLLLEKARDFRARLGITLNDPESPDFEETSKVVQASLEDPVTKGYARHVITGGRMDVLTMLYRNAQQFKNDEIHGPFYSQLADVLSAHAETISSFSGFMTRDDLEEIYTPNEEIKPPTPTVDDLRKNIAAIIPFAPKEEYGVDPDSIDWTEITPPQEVAVAFNPGKPMQFYIDLSYQGDVEQAVVSLGVDAKKGAFDWNFIEAPDDPKMKPFHDATMRVAEQVLERVGERAKAEKEQEKAAKQVQRPPERPPTKEKREHPVREEEQVSAKRKRSRTEISPEAGPEESSQQEEQGVTKTVVMPTDKELDDIIKNLSQEDRAKVIKGIEEFNDRGVGGFKMLATRDAQGNRLFALRVNTGSKGIRVLVKEGESGENKRAFEILDIQRRGNIYKKNKI